MRLQALLALLTMFALAFAGCAGETGGDDGDDVQPSATQTTTQAATSTTSASTPTSASSTTTAQPPTNKPPTGSITAVVDGLNASFSLTGSDPDGDTVVWDLDFGDGETTSGTTLPATVDHTYAPGNFSVAFTVTDGSARNSYSLAISVLGANVDMVVFTGAQEFPSSPLMSFEISTPVVSGFLGASVCVGFNEGENGQDCVWFELDASLVGKDFTLTADEGDPDYEFWPACSPMDDSATPPVSFAIAGSIADGPESGTIPEGAGCIVIWAKLPPAMPTYTFTIG
jgi:hypothetical protein